VSALEASATGQPGEKVAQLKAIAAAAAHDKDINAVAVAPNDVLICTGSQDRSARVRRPHHAMTCLTLSPAARCCSKHLALFVASMQV
jgi:hypothetical protein